MEVFDLEGSRFCMCVSIKEAQNSQVLIQLSPAMAQQNPERNNMAVHPTWKKRK